MFFAKKNVANELLQKFSVTRRNDIMQLLRLTEDNGIRVAFNGYGDFHYQGSDLMINNIKKSEKHSSWLTPYVVPYQYSGHDALNLDNLAAYADFLNLRFDIHAALTFVVLNKERLLKIDNNLQECEEGNISLVFRIDFERPAITGKPTKAFEEKYKPAFGIVRVIYGTVYFHINQGEGAVRELPGKWNILAFR
jgi:hypothetical protein